jgi:hypothetical protein
MRPGGFDSLLFSEDTDPRRSRGDRNLPLLQASTPTISSSWVRVGQSKWVRVNLMIVVRVDLSVAEEKKGSSVPWGRASEIKKEEMRERNYKLNEYNIKR